MGNCCGKDVRGPTNPAQAGKVQGHGEIQISNPAQVQNSQEVRGKSSSLFSHGVEEKHSKAIGHSFRENHEDQKLSKARKLTIKGVPTGGPLHALQIPCNVLKAATCKFDERNLIGRGGFGDVYKGWINLHTMTAALPGEGCMVAVKRLRKEGAQGRSEWKTELDFLSQFDHPNVVKLIGYCLQAKLRVLVYEYMPRGSLESCLLKESGSVLSWSRRIKVAIGVAKGLAYLHTASKPVVHRDVKSSNILLDSKFNPKLSDFGLAKYGPQGDKTHVTTRVLGTHGYFAPEYVSTGHLTLMTDVYSFGVVLLEIISGSGAMRKDECGLVIELVSWAKPLLSDMSELHHVIDKRLWQKLCIEEASEFTGIVLRCLNSNPKGRPTIIEVVAALEKLEQSRKDLGLSPSNAFDRRLKEKG